MHGIAEDQLNFKGVFGQLRICCTFHVYLSYQFVAFIPGSLSAPASWRSATSTLPSRSSPNTRIRSSRGERTQSELTKWKKGWRNNHGERIKRVRVDTKRTTTLMYRCWGSNFFAGIRDAVFIIILCPVFFIIRRRHLTIFPKLPAAIHCCIPPFPGKGRKKKMPELHNLLFFSPPCSPSSCWWSKGVSSLYSVFKTPSFSFSFGKYIYGKRASAGVGGGGGGGGASHNGSKEFSLFPPFLPLFCYVGKCVWRRCKFGKIRVGGESEFFCLFWHVSIYCTHGKILGTVCIIKRMNITFWHIFFDKGNFRTRVPLLRCCSCCGLGGCIRSSASPGRQSRKKSQTRSPEEMK